MKRTLLTGTFYLLAGAAGLLLAASIFYSCRSGGDPHHSDSAAALNGAPVVTTGATQLPKAPTEGRQLSLARVDFPTSNPPVATE